MYFPNKFRVNGDSKGMFILHDLSFKRIQFDYLPFANSTQNYVNFVNISLRKLSLKWKMLLNTWSMMISMLSSLILEVFITQRTRGSQKNMILASVWTMLIDRQTNVTLRSNVRMNSLRKKRRIEVGER